MTTNGLPVWLLAITTLCATGAACAQATPGAPPATTTAAAESQCPPSLPVQQTPSSGAVPARGWQARGSNVGHPLTHIAIYHGPPGDAPPLKPNAQQRIARAMTTQWNLAPSPRGYWVACGYAGTTATAARPLDRNVTSCVAEHDLGKSPPVLTRWSCRSDGVR